MIRATEIPNLSKTTAEIRNRLKSGETVIACSADHYYHVAVYTAWLEQPGRVLIFSHLLPEHQQQHLVSLASNQHQYLDSLMFCTSGTTGMPKLIVHDRNSMAAIAQMSQEVFGWDKNQIFVSLFPAGTSAFWHILIPAFVEKQFRVIFSSRDTLKKDFILGNAVGILMPGMIDMLMAMNINMSLSGYEKILSGGSRIKTKHAQYVLANGAKQFDHSFGSTETGSPLLSREMTSFEQGDFTCLRAKGGMMTQLVDGELWVKGPALAVNLWLEPEGWYRTGDYWQQGSHDLIKFIGRNDDLIKMNGYNVNLNDVEDWFSARGFGECLAIPHQKIGIDWIELLHVGKLSDYEKNIVKEKAKIELIPCSVPRKFKLVNELEKTVLGKKRRVRVD